MLSALSRGVITCYHRYHARYQDLITVTNVLSDDLDNNDNGRDNTDNSADNGMITCSCLRGAGKDTQVFARGRQPPPTTQRAREGPETRGQRKHTPTSLGFPGGSLLGHALCCPERGWWSFGDMKWRRREGVEEERD